MSSAKPPKTRDRGSMKKDPDKVLVIPCSGIGKVHGLLSRESAYLAIDELAPTETDAVCLALLVREDEETLAKVRAHPCITIDGCAKACARKNIEIAGGEVAKAFQVARVLSGHRGAQPGTGSELTEEGWAISREIAESVAEDAARICAGEEVT
jgi:uncharacterized metal-binding protein